MISKENLKDMYPLAPMQEGMLFHSVSEPESRAYFEQICLNVSGDFDVNAFKSAWRELFARHDILRTAFIYEKTKRPLQIVLKERQPEFLDEDLSAVPDSERSSSVQRIREEDILRGFDLAKDPLMRFFVINLGGGEHEIIWSVHHILMDGWGISIIQNEFYEAYIAAKNNRAIMLPSPAQYSTYIKWLEKLDKNASLAYWARALSGYERPANIPASSSSDAKAPYSLKKHSFIIGKERTSDASALAASMGVTMNIIFQAALSLVLGAYNDTGDVVFGTVVSTRPEELPGSESMLGLFINTIPARCVFNFSESFSGICGRMMQDSIKSQNHKHCFLGDILSATPMKSALFDTLLVFENYPISENIGAGKAGFSARLSSKFEQTSSGFLMVVNPGESFAVELHYNANVYDDIQAEMFAGHLLNALDFALSSPNAPIGELSVLSEEERRKVLFDFQGEKHDYPIDKSVIGAFEAQISERKEATAVVDSNGSVTYGELDAFANGIASTLYAKAGIGAGDVVAVIMGRTRWLPASLFGILKLGGVYLPCDPSYPFERIKFMIEDSGCKAIITDMHGEAAARLVELAPVIETQNIPAMESFAGRGSSGDEAAYLIYTSGSTGTPKGALISNRSVLNLCYWHRRFYNIDESSRSTLFASISFDASVWEILTCLLMGARLYPLSDEIRQDPANLISFYLDNSITHAFIPPSVLSEVLAQHNGSLNGKLTLLTGGDVLRNAGNGAVAVANNYGPTECAVVSAASRIHADAALGQYPIGRPIDNATVYILDGNKKPVPIGARGEMYIGGCGVGMGYVNRADLTAACIFPDPFRAGSRMYKTGDAGRYRHNGLLEFLGRRDNQVKIRGNRVEPGEIERRMMEVEHISDSAVVCRNGGDNLLELVGFYASTAELSNSSIRSALSTKLPDYMIPSLFIKMNPLPRNESGKVDRRALEKLAESAPRNGSKGGSPRCRIEDEMSKLWASILGVAEVGVFDNFFDLGGHSIKAAQLSSRIRKEFKVDATPKLIFENPTVELICTAIEKLERHGEAHRVESSIKRTHRAPQKVT